MVGCSKSTYSGIFISMCVLGVFVLCYGAGNRQWSVWRTIQKETYRFLDIRHFRASNVSTTAADRGRVLTTLSFQPSRDSPYVGFNRETPLYTKSTQDGMNKTKTILFWTTWYGQKVWWNMDKKMGMKPFQDRHCYHKNCVLTNDKSKLKQADLLLFYFGDKPKFPKERYTHQYYAHFIHEPPIPGHSRLANEYDGKINLTLNYRYDSDIYLPYNMIVKTTKATTGLNYTKKVPFEKKVKSVVWPVSHCKTSSRREEYVKELSKYIDVDIFGGCGAKKCPRTKTMSCLEEWGRTYKFYLSFENNVCVDYITEKMYHPLGQELIPIVLGGGNYSRDAPPYSVINVRDFESPRDLAEYLHYLSEHEEEYNRYFEWKPYYEILPMPSWTMCRLCDFLHEGQHDGKKSVAAASYWNWYGGKNGEMCDNDLIGRMRTSGNW